VQGAEWIFLAPNGSGLKRRHAKAYLSLTAAPGGSRPKFWSDQTLDPTTPEAMFCVMPKGARDPTLENLSSQLIAATEALANEEAHYLGRRGGPSRRCYFAAVVTTARLMVCEFDPNSISLVDGTIPTSQMSAHEAVRFTKQLSTQRETVPKDVQLGSEAEALANAKDRTAFVVRAPYLNKFLSLFTVDGRD
jgi:hypothetical protein